MRSLPHKRFWPFSRPLPAAKVDVLYVHGWSDYFFQTEVADFWRDLGANFYALDLRRYGRSIRKGQTLGLIDDLSRYDEDLDAALGVMGYQKISMPREAAGSVARVADAGSEFKGNLTRSAAGPEGLPTDGDVAAPAPDIASAEEAPTVNLSLFVERYVHPKGRKLVLMGHSTGGLTLSLWAARYPGSASALVLNSPWLEFQGRSVLRSAIKPLLDLSSKLAPKEFLPNVDFGFYSRITSATEEGEWSYNLDWRPLISFPVPVVWLRAVLEGHHRVMEGLALETPTLVMLSEKSVLSLSWQESMRKADTVLDTEVIAQRALDLGNCVTVARIPDALHDVFLSPLAVRTRAFEQLRNWLLGYLPR